MHLKRIYVLRISLFISTMLILISRLPDLYIISMISPIYLKFTPQFRKVLWFDFGFAFDGTCLVQFLTILCFPITLLFGNSLAFQFLCFGPFFVRNQNFASGVGAFVGGFTGGGVGAFVGAGFAGQPLGGQILTVIFASRMLDPTELVTVTVTSRPDPCQLLSFQDWFEANTDVNSDSPYPDTPPPVFRTTRTRSRPSCDSELAPTA